MDILVLYTDKENPYENVQSFGGESARNLCTNALKNLCGAQFSFDKGDLSSNDNLSFIHKLCEVVVSAGEGVEDIIFSFSDCPFMNQALSKKVLAAHKDYFADFSQSLGFIEGLAPVVIKRETLFLLEKLLPTETYKKIAHDPVTKKTLFNILSLDINSYEIEDILSEGDYRLLRLVLDCSDKKNYLSCLSLYDGHFSKNKSTSNEGGALDISALDAEEVCKIVKDDIKVLRTVPNFYMIDPNMGLDKFSLLLEKIDDTSDSAIVSLSEPKIDLIRALYQHPGLKLLIETKSDLITEDLAKEIKKIITSSPTRRGNEEYFSSIAWIVDLTKELFNDNDTASRSSPAFNNRAIEILKESFDDVYPQMIRTKDLEEKLEDFFRYWSDKDSPSRGLVIIQKYSDYCKTLPSLNSVDLSPLERNYCYHIRRDMKILSNGDVTLCQFQPKIIIGNVFSDKTLTEIFNSADNNSECEKCDEYYTFNF